MVLRPLEFADCLSDTPWFRQNLREHESVLEDAHKNIKNIEIQCRELIHCTRKLSVAQRAFAKSLKEFKFVTIGSTQTDDERKIAECVSKFGDFISQIEDHREKIIEDSEIHFIEPLRKFRVEGIGKVLHDDKKRYEKESNKFYASLEKHLHLSTARKNDFKEADAQLDMQQRNFCSCSLDYVTAIQAVQERMKFEFVETLCSFVYSWLTFYHVGHVTHEDFKPFLSEVQSKVQKAKESFEETKEYYVQLKDKMLINHLKNAVFQTGKNDSDNENPTPRTVSSIKQGYIFAHEKSKIPKTISRDVLSNRWTMYYCVYQKETRIFTMIPVNNTARTDMKGALGQSVSFKLKTCTRRASDSIDKRFCFDVLAMDRTEQMTLQALSEEDRRQWLDAMDGREPIYSPGTGPTSNCLGTVLDDSGFDFVRKCIEAIEEKGICEQGLYRNCGVTSKVQKLLQIGLDKRRSIYDKLSFTDDEWEIKTLSSALKTFLRNLPEPLMTFDLHHHFINAAKMDSKTRVSYIHYFVYKLPQIHFEMLQIIIEHLKKVANRSSENLMTVGNLAVCFGPTLLRPKEETMAAIMDIKFCNVVVEVLIANYDLIFKNKPKEIDNIPCPARSNDQEEFISESSSFGETGTGPSIAFSKQQIVSISQEEKRSQAEGTSISSKRPQTIASSSKCQRPPPIYDRVPYCYTDSNDDLNMSSSNRSMHTAAYNKPSTSAGTSPVTPIAKNSLTCSSSALTQNTTKCQMRQPLRGQSTAHLRGATEHERRTSVGKKCAESWESLNSASTGSDPLPNERFRHHYPKIAQERHTTTSRAKLNTSYAPAYNPFSSESGRRKISPLPVSKYQQHRCFDLSRQSKNVNLPDGDDVTDDVNVCGDTPTVTEVLISDLRVSPLFTCTHTLGALQPSRRVKTLYACTAGHNTELSFQPGQIITNVYESKEDGWLIGTLNGKTGLIPANYVEPLP
ncbi:Rho-GTPase-activating, putative [Brugia malayi]|uniref:Rho-GTPase-activating, putative n=1 Tax=Brugia malayi TaxID=6279 RepID=A0A4E9FCQ9_BRUMA|nr:Rho-GTPase-activating, putative [Brugia malayi]VIO92538.1 Rho-GTPase-activating, putative [Brugia malayi]